MAGDWDVVGSSAAAAAANPWDVAGTTDILPAWQRLPLAAASNAAQGAADTLTAPSDVLTFGGKLAAGLAAKFNGGKVPAALMTAGRLLNHVLPPTSADVSGWGRNAGVFDNPALAPQSETEAYLDAGARGGGSALPFGPEAVPSGVASGVGARAAQQLAPEHPLLASVIGGTAGAMGYAGLRGSLTRSLRAALGESGAATADYDALGITPRLAGDVSGRPAMQMVQAFAAKNPFSVGRVTDAANATMGEFGTAVDNTASMLGPEKTLAQAGATLQGASARWMSNFRQTNAANWGTLDQFVPPTTPVKVTGYQNALDSISDTLPKAPETAGVLQPAMSRNLKTALGNDLQQSGGSLPWATVKNIRTRIGEMLSDPNLPADTSTAELKRLYAGLTGDMKGAVTVAGPQAQAAFDAATAYTRNGHQFIDGILKPFLKTGTTPEQAATNALNAAGRGGSKITAIRTEMPDAADALGAYTIRDMGAATAGAQNAAGNASSAASFLTDLNRMSPEARASLFDRPDVQAKLGALARVSDGIKTTSKFANTSNTGVHTTMQGLLARAGLAYGAFHAGGHYGGPLAATIGAVAPFADIPLASVAGRVVTSPFVSRMMSLPQKSYFSAPASAAGVFSSLPQNQQQLLLAN